MSLTIAVAAGLALLAISQKKKPVRVPAPPVVPSVPQALPRDATPAESAAPRPAAAKPAAPRPAAAKPAAPRPAAAKPAAPVVRPPASGRESEALQAAIAAEALLSAKKKPAKAPPIDVYLDPKNAGASAPPAGRVSAPPGYDAPAAKASAQSTADHIRSRSTKYDRQALSLFQRRAGMVVDGLFGPASASALRYYGAKSVPAPLFKGALKTYVPPGGAK